VLGDVADRRDVIGGDRVAEDGEDPRAGQVGERWRRRGHAVE